MNAAFKKKQNWTSSPLKLSSQNQFTTSPISNCCTLKVATPCNETIKSCKELTSSYKYYDSITAYHKLAHYIHDLPLI